MRAQEGLLQRVLGLLERAEHVAAEAQERAVVAVVEGLERALVTVRGKRREAIVPEPRQAERGERVHP